MRSYLFAGFLLLSSVGYSHQAGDPCPNHCCPITMADGECSICPCYPPIPKLLDPHTQPKFKNKLVNVLEDDFIFKPKSDEKYKITRKPFTASLGIFDKNCKPLMTPMFGFTANEMQPTYPGRTIVVESNKPVKITWENDLVDCKNRPIPMLTYVPVDQTIHCAMPMAPPYPQSGIPTVAHLHGGLTESRSDGYPDSWITPNFAQVGPTFLKKRSNYSNSQDGAMLWYHEHALGFTRLSTYAGLIGAYIIRDENEKELIRHKKIPSKDYEVALIIVDKKFTSDGQLFLDYCNPEESPGEPQPSVQPEFFGDFILVNGKAWPYLSVEPRNYRLRILNGCDSRFLNLRFKVKVSNEILTFYQIGTDQGLLNQPFEMNEILLGPGQRADLVIDFSKYKDDSIFVTNDANTPFPCGDPVDPETTGLVMKFKVTKKFTKEHSEICLPEKLRKIPIKNLAPTAPNRQVLLFESQDKFGRILPLLGTPELGGLMFQDPVTETPLFGTTEIWEIYNTTEDAHPIHLHATYFKILDRQYFCAKQDPITGALSQINLLGDPIQPSPVEKDGIFDIVIAPPGKDGPEGAIGQMTRIIAEFNIPGNFVWHCHILSHEDNEMMRPMKVVLNK